MRKLIALLLSFVLSVTVVCSGCGRMDSYESLNGGEGSDKDVNQNINMDASEDIAFDGLGDAELLNYVEHCVYGDIVSELDSAEYFVENVSTVYISNEYLAELSYNSKENVYFGYTLRELEEQFQEMRYVFTLGADGKTVVEEFSQADTTYDEIMKNMAVGTGVILVCVTVSSLSGVVGASTVSVIFAASAKTGTSFALSAGVFSAVSAGVVAAIETGSMDEAIEAAAVAGSEDFKWGAMAGVLFGGVKEAVALKGATLNGLTMKEAAEIQKESKYPIDVIKKFASKKQYQICKSAGLTPKMVKGKRVLVRQIDLDAVDNMGRTNLERMKLGLAALDPSGKSYELHHIGQKADSTLAILTKAEHMQNGNNKIWHVLGETTEVHGSGNTWDVQRKEIWKALAEILEREF